MPVEVPKEPKKFTTVYDNFKGVDFTNDASNVFKRRSPSGLNMLPDLDGRPHKRTGWEVVASVDDFIEEAGILGATKINPKRTHHFSYGGSDFLMIFNSLGVFWMMDGSNELNLAQRWNGSAVDVFPPEETRKKDGIDVTVKLEADANRAFFFEGNGEAGFYVFVENTLWKFADDGHGLLFYKVEPKIPIVIIGADPTTGAGTDFQAVNILTSKRTVEYFGDDSKTEYHTPEPIEAQTDISIQMLDVSSGVWSDVAPDDDDYPWQLTAPETNIIEFTDTAPPTSNVGNVRITYAPFDGAGHKLETNVETKKASITNERVVVKERERRVYTNYLWNKKKRRWDVIGNYVYPPEDWKTLRDEYSYQFGTVDVPNLFDEFEVWSDYTGTNAVVTNLKLITDWGAYTSSVDIGIPDSTIAGSMAPTVTNTDWVTTHSETLPTTYGGSIKTKEVVSYQKQTITQVFSKTFNVWGKYTKSTSTNANESVQNSREAFSLCRKALTFGNNIYNQTFISASTLTSYRNRVWYCAANDPSYFPDTNFMEVGADDKPVMGLMKAGSYLGIVKMGSGTGASVYLAYATSFDEETTYAVKQSVSGVGAISTGAFNILNEEPLFLSERGVMGVDISETDVNKQIRNRSHFINKRLLSEQNLSNAISYVFDGMYYLAINNHCYVLDGSQKSSWANEKTNLQYECYYLDNVPAQCFASMGGRLYFIDNKGALCRFKKPGELFAYTDEYSVNGAKWEAAMPPDENNQYDVNDLSGTSGDSIPLTVNYYDDNDALHEDDYLTDSDGGRFLVLIGEAVKGETVQYMQTHYSITDVEEYTGEELPLYSAEDTYEVGNCVRYGEEGEEKPYMCNTDIDDPEEWTPEHWNEIKKRLATVSPGVPINARWSTIADDDEMVHFFKNLTKKGFVISLLPESNMGVDVLLKPDEKDAIFIGTLPVAQTTLPYDMFVRKKIKKYKRLQIICENNSYNDGFGIDQIIKTYTVGNYSKNRR